MSQFNKFAKQLDQLAKKYFADYETEKTVFDVHRERFNGYPDKAGASVEYQAKAAKAKSAFLESQASLNRCKAVMLESVKEVKQIRNELEKAVVEAYSARTADVDPNVVTLLSSGILSSEEYASFILDYQKAGNYTMAKLCGASALKAAGQAASNDIKRELMSIGHAGMKNPASDILKRFDDLSLTYATCMKNPALSSKWESMTGQAIAGF